MADREFPSHTVTGPNGSPFVVLRAECADCGATADYPRRNHPSIAAVQHFRKSGWRIGNGPRVDKCPKCLAAPIIIAPSKETPVAEKAKPLHLVPTTPRTMGREDRKLIFDEIAGCYDKDAGRYMDGWTDERVAKALGAHVPRGWVTEIREDFFGPSGSNEEFDRYLEKLKPVETEAAQIKSLQAQLADRMTKLDGVMAELSKLASEVRRASGLGK
jgi:hypothetical protein